MTNEPKDATGSIVFGPGWQGGGPVAFRSPDEVFIAHRLEDVRPVLARACTEAERGRYVAGFVAYEAAPAFDPALVVKSPVTPLVWMASYDNPCSRPSSRDADCPSPTDAGFAYEADRYRDLVGGLLDHIREGDVYQINFTGPLDFSLTCRPYGLFDRLLARQPVPYAAFVDTGEIQVVSCSPELFFERHGRCVSTRPMKGTVRRGRRFEEDEALERWLSNDEKSRAENLMIVDLLRNDLSRCCEPGSVRVPELFTTERYRTVIQMTSQVEGRLRPGATTADVFEALFPCGSVTGAPKIRAMELIDRYESEPRGIYCGAVGCMHRDRAVFNVAIRTVTVRGSRGRLGIGSGIVWDSDPAAEYEECLLKARFLTGAAPPPGRAGGLRVPGQTTGIRHTPRNEEPPRLLETMRSVDGRVPLFERHVDRIRTSSRTLGYAFDEPAFRRQTADSTPARGTYKIRAAVAFDGTVDVESTVLDDEASREWKATVSETRIDSADVFRRHKTTRRREYDEAYKAAAAEGFDEVIFLNERVEVAEGSRTNVVAVVGGSWITPPVHCGALPGVYRRFLLETRDDIDEAVLSLEDLRRADAVYLCNAVRGLVRLEFLLAPDRLREDVTQR